MKRFLVIFLALMLPLMSLAEVDLTIAKAVSYDVFIDRINKFEQLKSTGLKFTPAKGTLIQTQAKGKTPFVIDHTLGTIRGLLQDGMVDSFKITMKFPGDAYLMAEAAGALLPDTFFEQFDNDEMAFTEMFNTVYIGRDETLTLSGYRVQVSDKTQYGIPSEFTVIYLGESKPMK